MNNETKSSDMHDYREANQKEDLDENIVISMSEIEACMELYERY